MDKNLKKSIIILSKEMSIKKAEILQLEVQRNVICIITK